MLVNQCNEFKTPVFLNELLKNKCRQPAPHDRWESNISEWKQSINAWWGKNKVVQETCKNLCDWPSLFVVPNY